MLTDDDTASSSLSDQSDGFAARLRQALESYGSTSAFARAINRSEGAVRKWLRGQSEPNVSDLRTICVITGVSADWLVLGRGERQMSFGPSSTVRDTPFVPYGPAAASGEEPPLPPLNYSLMDDVMTAVRLEPRIAGNPITPAKCSSILTTVYNMSRVTRRVDPEGAERVVGLAS